MTKAEAKSKVRIDALESTIAELKADKGKPQDPTPNVDITALQEGFATMKKELAQEKLKASREGLKSMASDLNAVSGGQVATLIAPFIKYEGDKTFVLNAKGEVRYSGEGEGVEMTVKEFVKEFLNDNPHLVKASKNSGAGSASAKGKGGGISVEDLRKIPPAERMTKIREREQAKK
jgi:hypothetical protein